MSETFTLHSSSAEAVEINPLESRKTWGLAQFLHGRRQAVGRPPGWQPKVKGMRRKLRQLLLATVVVALGAIYAGAFAGSISGGLFG